MVEIDAEMNLFAKTPAIAAEWVSKKLHPRAKKITIALAQYLAFLGYPCVLTCIHRKDAGVHGAWRAIDVRSNNAKQEDAELVREKINRRFVYGLGGDGKPRDTIPPLNHAGNTMRSTAEHFHIQVRP